ncbi:aminodeoxychorismate synthase component I [Cryobacterium mesophilum]|uniref:aminodeoxychorismate synthase n=1 Tax=Terrimesophilobacter mesophilus TaxID=433647 RepID=A0A4R8V7L5_9MICO|nr:aminodeoxychorismate synthase component I [Terrimesophilobacter mesophilus]MBB5632271.1 aminodeoxychorismate synthase component I [Terrimesophilobacter mesophilus]TFB79121.1 aminodeoxychorismate synthase component I [Terrimesophilobacter mesophilus]
MRRRVIASRFGGWIDPAACFSALCGETLPAFWLDSGAGAAGALSALGIGSRVVTRSVVGTAPSGGLTEWPSGELLDESVFAFLEREQRAGLAGEGVPGFPLGWIGWLGYELHEETLATGPGRVSRYADAAFMLADRAVVFDHARREVSLVALGDDWSGELEEWRMATVGILEACRDSESTAEPARAADAAREEAQVRVEWAYSEHEYGDMILECQRSIRSGDAYQLCLTNQVSVDVHPDPVATYLTLRAASPSHHGAFLRMAGVCVLSSTPEVFLTATADGIVESRPIKGTRRRGATPAEDRALLDELVGSEKERAENLMIVDLVRNDLSRVCAVGSVTVPHLLEVESYAQVHQLVSTVRGRLAEGSTGIDAVRACFPAGSMTGAPKLSAVRLLDALEQRPRGIYSGAFGYFGLDGRIDLAMTIRTIVIDANGATVGTGGGITALSVPEEEIEETRIKAAALLRALGLVTL